MGTEIVRILPVQGVFVPRISHDSQGNRVIPLLAGGQSYDSGVFQVRGYNKLDIITRSNVNADIFVYMGPDPVALAAMVPDDKREKARFPYAELAIPNGDFPPEQYSVQVSGEFARVVYRNNTIEAQTVWDYQINLKPIGEGQCFRQFNEEDTNPLQFPIYRYLTMTPDYRLRVEVASGGSSDPVSVRGEQEVAVWAANNASPLVGNSIPANPDDGRFAIASAALPSMAGSIKEFTIYAEILPGPSGAGAGHIIIEAESAEGVAPWVEFDRLPVASGQRILRTYKLQAQSYRVYFLNTGAAQVTGFYGNVYIKPQT